MEIIRKNKTKMKLWKINDYNPEISLLGGHNFFWKRINENEYISFHNEGGIYLYKSKGFWRAELLYGFLDIENYFQLDIDYDAILSTLSKDIVFKKPVSELRGLKLTSQPFFDVLISFIISSNNNINRIRKSVLDITKNYGAKQKNKIIDINNFPAPEKISNITAEELKEKTGVGYRAGYLTNSAKLFIKDKDDIINYKEDILVEKLKEFPGVGDKVADCVAIYSGRAQTFSPMDRWATKILYDVYDVDFKKYKDARKWWKMKFGKNASYAGQFLFEYYRRR